MDLNDLIPIVAIICVIGIPVAAIAIRTAIHPMVRDLIGAVRSRSEEEEEDLQQRLARVEERLQLQAQKLDRLVEAELFRRRLESGETVPERRPDLPVS